MKPTKIIFEKTATHWQLRVLATGTQKGYVVIESTPIGKGDCVHGMRRHAQKYAKRFGIPFADTVAEGR